MNEGIEWLKVVGSLAGLAALIWNISSAYFSRRGELEVNLGWKTNREDLSTYLYIDVVNKGIDTRVIDYVSVVYLDEKPKKNSRHSTEEYISFLPGLTLKRGEKGIEKIFYKENDVRKELLLNRKILFRVTDTLGKSYDSTKLNDGVFELPEKSVN